MKRQNRSRRKPQDRNPLSKLIPLLLMAILFVLIALDANVGAPTLGPGIIDFLLSRHALEQQNSSANDNQPQQSGGIFLGGTEYGKLDKPFADALQFPASEASNWLTRVNLFELSFSDSVPGLPSFATASSGPYDSLISPEDQFDWEIPGTGTLLALNSNWGEAGSAGAILETIGSQASLSASPPFLPKSPGAWGPPVPGGSGGASQKSQSDGGGGTSGGGTSEAPAGGSTGGGSTTIVSVPDPQTFWLLALGLTGLLVFCQKL